MLRRREEIERVPMLVDGAVQILPLAFDRDVGFVDADRTTVRLCEERQRFSINGA